MIKGGNDVTEILTKSSMPIIKWVAEVLGLLMNGIYFVLSRIGITNVGLAIILFTIILLMAMMPLQIKQQRFSKLTGLMQPEIQRIQNKFKNKKDQVSQQKMMDETNAVYAKYGVSPTGSCVQLLIQMPVLFALYQVIYKIPGYITIIGNKIGAIASDSAFVDALSKFVKAENNSTLTRNFSSGAKANVIDTVYGLTTKQWDAFLKEAGNQFPTLEGIHRYVKRATSFAGLNISDSPFDIIKNAWTDRQGLWILLIVAALLFPILAWFTQWLNYKLMPQPAQQNGDAASSTMTQTMNSMNNFMPIMSAFFCLTLPTGVGIYWIMSAVVRSVQQFFINKKLDSESEEDIIRAAQEKNNRKREKQGLPPQKITSAAHVSTRSFEVKDAEKTARNNRAEGLMSSSQESGRTARPGSLAAKANMVKTFDEQHNKKR